MCYLLGGLMPRDMSTIGQRIKALRIKRGYKQVVLASLAGITQGSLSLIETDKTAVPAGETLAALCKALQTTPEFIIAGAGDPDSIEQAMSEHELVFIWRELPIEARALLLENAKATRRAFKRPDDGDDAIAPAHKQPKSKG